MHKELIKTFQHFCFSKNKYSYNILKYLNINHFEHRIAVFKPFLYKMGQFNIETAYILYKYCEHLELN